MPGVPTKASRGRLLVVSHACVLPVNQDVYRALVELGWDLTLVVPETWRNEYAAQTFASRALEELEGSLRPLPVVLAGRPQRHLYRDRLTRVIRENDPQFVLLEEESFALAAGQWGFAAHRAGVPFGVQAAENLNRRLPRVAEVVRGWTLRHATLVIARSPTAAALATRWGARGRTELIPHAVPRWEIVPKSPDRVFTVGFAGRLVPEKGIYDLLEAAGELDAPIRVLLVGNGGLRGELEQVNLVNGRLETLTSILHHEMPRAYAEMDVLVLPSRTTASWAEQFGRVLVEALWCGVPVIGSDSGEIPWVIETTGGGRVYAEGEVDELAHLLHEFRANPAMRDDLASRGRHEVAERFGVDAVAWKLDATLLAVR